MHTRDPGLVSSWTTTPLNLNPTFLKVAALQECQSRAEDVCASAYRSHEERRDCLSGAREASNCASDVALRSFGDSQPRLAGAMLKQLFCEYLQDDRRCCLTESHCATESESLDSGAHRACELGAAKPVWKWKRLTTLSKHDEHFTDDLVGQLSTHLSCDLHDQQK